MVGGKEMARRNWKRGLTGGWELRVVSQEGSGGSDGSASGLPGRSPVRRKTARALCAVLLCCRREVQ
jgi:hypothetical protein